MLSAVLCVCCYVLCRFARLPFRDMPFCMCIHTYFIYILSGDIPLITHNVTLSVSFFLAFSFIKQTSTLFTFHLLKIVSSEKLKRVENSANHWVTTLDCGAGHYFFFVIVSLHPVLSSFRSWSVRSIQYASPVKIREALEVLQRQY
jgi:hypothetical protein